MMSEEENYFDMNDEEFFPIFLELPDENDPDTRYFDDPGSFGMLAPIKHWCLLVEIIQEIAFIRPMFRVKDKTNKEFLVVFSFDTGVQMPKIWRKRCKEGGVIAIMYATAHFFADGQQGIRVEEAEYVKFIPCSLNALFRIGDDIDKPINNKCVVCKKPGGLQCARCARTKYCGKGCQVAHWKSRHQTECVALQQVLDWREKDWEEFEGYWTE